MAHKSNSLSYLIIFLSAVVMEISTIFYVSFIVEKNIIGMVALTGFAPFLALPFIGYMVQSKKWSERIKMAAALSLGAMLGSLIVNLIIKS